MSFCAFCVCVSGQRCEKQRGADWLARNSLCCSISSSSFPLSLRVPSIIECGNELKQRQPSAWLMRHNETSAVFRPLLSKFFSFFLSLSTSVSSYSHLLRLFPVLFLCVELWPTSDDGRYTHEESGSKLCKVMSIRWWW